MKMSLFQGILLGVFVLCAAIGLFVFATYTGNQGKNAVGTVTIWGTLPKNGIESLLSAAAQVDTTFKSVKYVQKDTLTLPSDLASAIATGGAPDLILASQEELHALTKFIVPIPREALSASTFTNTFIEGATIFTAPTGYFGIPFLVDPLVLFYNRPILASSGVAKPPATWEAFTGLVPHLALLTPSRGITRGLVALGTYDNVRNARGILSALFLQTGAPISRYSSSGLLVADLGVGEGGTSPGQAVIHFYTQFADPAKVSYTWNSSLPDSREEFLVGDVALYLGYASEARYFSQANPNLNFGVATLPQPGTLPTKIAYGRIYAFMISKGAKNSSGAFQVAAFFSGADKQSPAALATGLAPVVLDALGGAPEDPVAAVAHAEALYTKGWLSPAARDTDAVFSAMIHSVINGRLTSESALRSAEGALTALLQQ